MIKAKNADHTKPTTLTNGLCLSIVPGEVLFGVRVREVGFVRGDPLSISKALTSYHQSGIVFIMKTKTSITLSNEILTRLNTITSAGKRSDFIERALWRYIELLQREKRNQADLNIINKISLSLNKEAEDVLRYQADR
jgi:hypothetical protein